MLDAAGKDLVFLETVGAGQSEVEVITIADTVLLVLMPGSGDSIQALKAGIMEIPDVIAVNKRDHPAAKTMVSEVRSILALDTESDWDPPIVLTEALRGEGIEELWDRLAAHRRFLEDSGTLEDAAGTQPCRRGLRGRKRPGQDTPGGDGRRRRGASALARRGAAPRDRSAHCRA